MKDILLLLAVVVVAFSTFLLYKVTEKLTGKETKSALQYTKSALSLKTKPVFVPEPLTLEKIFSNDHSWTASLSAEKTRTLIATGDVIPARAVNAQTLKKGDFTWPFAKTAEVLRGADITLVNLETPLIANCSPTTEGMTFCGDSRHVEGLVFAGVDVASLANNHSGNYGETGIGQTINSLSSVGILATGTSPGPAYLDVKGLKFAFLGYNDVGVSPKGVSPAEEPLISQDISTARKTANIVVVSFHWGIEYVTQPTTRQVELGHLAIDSGTDLVIGNHPHWIQPVEIYKGKLITYAHGNFIFDQEWSEKTKLGVVGRYTFYEDSLIDAEFLPIKIADYGQSFFLEGLQKENILKEMQEESNLVGNN